MVEDLDLAAEPAALAAAGRSLDSCGLLLLGEMHGVRENPLVIRAVMQAFGLTSLALEWPDELAPVIRTFLAGEPLADHPWLWGGDGRITAGHLAMLAERSTAGPLGVILLNGVIGAGWSWSHRDEAMARRLLAAPPQQLAHWRWQATPIPRLAPRTWAFRWAPGWPGSGRASGRSRSGTGAAVSGTSSHANSRAVPALKDRYGSTRTAANSFWTSP